jgi:hypothetical protein
MASKFKKTILKTLLTYQTNKALFLEGFFVPFTLDSRVKKVSKWVQIRLKNSPKTSLNRLSR